MPRKVFISSTSEDLVDYRQAVAQTVRDVGWQPVMMESFTSGPGYTVDSCCSRVAECELVILVVAFRIGWIPQRDQGGDGRRSITGWELSRAEQLGRPVIVLLATANTWPTALADRDRRLVDDFRLKLNRVAQFFDWESHDALTQERSEFAGVVRKCLSQHVEWLAERPAELLQEFSDQWGLPAEVRDLLNGLVACLGQTACSMETIRAEYFRTHPEGRLADAPFRATSLETLVDCALRLALLPRQLDLSHPLPDFLRRLCLYRENQPVVDGLTAQADTWNHYFKSQNSSPDFVPVRRDVPEEPRESEKRQPTTIVVWFEPAITQARAWTLHVWSASDGQLEPIAVEKELCTDLNRAELLGRMESQWRRMTDAEMTLEIVVPRHLLSEAIERWDVALTDEDLTILRPLGEIYPIVLRLRERSRSQSRFRQAIEQRWRNSLKDKWDRRCHVSQPASEQAADALIVVQNDREPRDLFRWAYPRKDVGGLLIDRPWIPAHPHGDAVLTELLTSGVPLVVWSRNDRDDQRIADELAELINGHALAQLPRRALLHRCDAKLYPLTAENLAVLCDHPDMQFPELLSAPYALPAEG